MNNLAEVERHARALMTLHGVGSLKFEFDNHKKRIGAMHYRRVNGLVLPEKITVSKHYASILTMDEIRETVLHEIAHALTPGDGHGPKWRAKAREFGIRPVPRKATSARPKATWTGVCGNCGEVRAEYHRAPLKAGWACSAVECKRVPTAKRLLVWYKHGKVATLGDMPDRYITDHYRIAKMLEGK